MTKKDGDISGRTPEMLSLYIPSTCVLLTQPSALRQSDCWRVLQPDAEIRACADTGPRASVVWSGCREAHAGHTRSLVDIHAKQFAKRVSMQRYIAKDDLNCRTRSTQCIHWLIVYLPWLCAAPHPKLQYDSENRTSARHWSRQALNRRLDEHARRACILQACKHYKYDTSSS
jgi:hypothetical protein